MGDKKNGADPFYFLFVEHLDDYPDADDRHKAISQPRALPLVALARKRHENLENRSSEVISLSRIKWRVDRLRASERIDPVNAIEAYIYAMESGVYPPMCVLKWIESAFRRYKKGRGNDSLESLLNIAPGKSGISNPFLKVDEEDRHYKILYTIAVLIELIGVSPGDAYEICSNKFSRNNDPMSPRTFRNLKSKHKEEYREIIAFFKEAEELLEGSMSSTIEDYYNDLIEHDAKRKMSEALGRRNT